MAKRLLLRDGENVSQDQLQRLLGVDFWVMQGPAGVGTGFAPGGVGQKPTASTGHLAVTANGTNMVITVLPGWAAVLRDAGLSTYDPRVLFAESDANDQSITIASNATGSTRNDTLCMKVDMNTGPNSDGSNLVSFVAINGQSGGGLSNAPADGNLYLPLANVAVANGATFVSQGNVSDVRNGIQNPGGVFPNGTTQVTANQGTFTALTDLTGLAVTVVVAAGRRIRITGYASLSSSVANDYMSLFIREGSTTLQGGQWPQGASTGGTLGSPVMVPLSPTAGTHTYKLSGQRSTGSGNITMNASTVNPAFILVEDLGPVH